MFPAIHPILICVQFFCAHPSLEKGFPKHIMLNQTQVWSKSSSVKLYTLIHPNLYQFQGHPCFRLKRSVEAQHPRNVLTSTEQHTLHTHTPGSSHLPRHTAIQGSNSGGIGAAATHYMTVFWSGEKWGWKEFGPTWLISSLSNSSMLLLSVFPFCLDNYSIGAPQTNDLDLFWQHCHITPIISSNSPIRGQRLWKHLHVGLIQLLTSVTFST